MPYYPSMQQMGRNPNMPTYDPQSPRMDFASWAAAMYKNLQEAKDRKTADAQMAEEQRWQEQLKPLQVRQLQAAIEASQAGTAATRATTERTKKTPVPVEQKPYSAPRAALIQAGKKLGIDTSDVDSWPPDFQQDVIGSLKQITLRETETAAQRTTEERAARTLRDAMLKEYRAKKTDLEKRYNDALKQAEEKYRAETAAARQRQSQLLSVEDPTQPNPYLISLRGAQESKKRMLKLLEQAKKDELDKLNVEYSSVLPGLSVKPKAPAQAPTQQAPQTMQDADEYGYVIGEIKDFPGGTYKYIGGNEWQQVK